MFLKVESGLRRGERQRAEECWAEDWWGEEQRGSGRGRNQGGSISVIAAPIPRHQRHHRHKHNNDNPQLSGTNQTLGNYGIQKLAASGIPSSKRLEVWNVWLIVGPIDFPH